MSLSLGLCILLLAITTGDVVRGQVAGPNAVALINGQAMLDCRTNLLAASSWTRTTDGTSNPLHIAVGCSVTADNAAYYRTEQPAGNICRLMIVNVTMQQAGVYACYDGASTVYRSLVTVIDPVANVVVYNQSEVVDNDQLNISCSMNYNGPSSPAPSLRPSPYWTTSPGQIFTSATSHPSTNAVTLVATVTVQKPTVPIFQCNTVFEITGNTVGYNSTAPADSFTVGNTPELGVQYGPSKPSSTSRPEVITNNGVPCGISVLTCSSTANPAPSYRWYDSADNAILSSTNTLTLAEINRNYKCETYNTVRNVTYNASTTYTVSKDNCASTINCCVFPRDETTSVKVEGCDNGTLCDCSQGSSGIILRCNAQTFPNATFMWSGPNVQFTDSPVYDKITVNGAYRCTAYFNKELSNYTGNVIFPNGTNETIVSSCSAQMITISRADNWMIIAVAISVYEIANLISMGFFLAYYNINTDANTNGNSRNVATHKRALNNRFLWLERMLPCINQSHGDFKRSNPSDLRATKPTSNSEEPHYQDLFKDRAGLRQRQSRQLPGAPKSRGRHFRKKMC